MSPALMRSENPDLWRRAQNGRYLDGTVDFLRIAQGTLAHADTTIEKLYAWEFDGPQTRDFTGR